MSQQHVIRRAMPSRFGMRAVGLGVVMALLVGAFPPDALAQSAGTRAPALTGGAPPPVEGTTQGEQQMLQRRLGSLLTEFRTAVAELRAALQAVHDAKVAGQDWLELGAAAARAFHERVPPTLGAWEQARGQSDPQVRRLLMAIAAEWNCPLSAPQRQAAACLAAGGGQQVGNAVRHADALLALTGDPAIAAAPGQAGVPSGTPRPGQELSWSRFLPAALDLRVAIQTEVNAKVRSDPRLPDASASVRQRLAAADAALGALEQRHGQAGAEGRRLLDQIRYHRDGAAGGGSQLTRALHAADRLVATYELGPRGTGVGPTASDQPYGTIYRLGDPASAFFATALLVGIHATIFTPWSLRALEISERIAAAEATGSSGPGVTALLGAVAGKPLDPGVRYCAPSGCIWSAASSPDWPNAFENSPTAFGLGVPSGFALGRQHTDWVRNYARWAEQGLSPSTLMRLSPQQLGELLEARGRFAAGLTGGVVNGGVAVVGTSMNQLLPKPVWHFTPSGPPLHGVRPFEHLADRGVDVLSTPQGHLRNDPDVEVILRNAAWGCTRDGLVNLSLSGGNLLAAGVGCGTTGLGGIVTADQLRVITMTPGGEADLTGRVSWADQPQVSSITYGQVEDFEKGVLDIAGEYTFISQRLRQLERLRNAPLPGPGRQGLTSGDPQVDQGVREDLRALTAQASGLRREAQRLMAELTTLQEREVAARRAAVPRAGATKVVRITDAGGVGVYQVIGRDSGLLIGCDGAPIPGPFIIGRRGCPEALRPA